MPSGFGSTTGTSGNTVANRKMLYGEKKLYEQTCSLKKGKGRLSPCLETLRGRISERLGIKIVNIVYDSIEIGPAKGQPGLNIIVERDDDSKRLCESPFVIRGKIRKTILTEFSDVVRQMKLQAEFDTRNVHLISDNFSDEAMNQAAFKLFHHDRKSLVLKFSSARVWDITGMSKYIVVFFLDEKAKRTALANGMANQIRQRCYEVIKRYDEFHYFTLENFSVTFDSKENLDINYQGNLFYYFR